MLITINPPLYFSHVGHTFRYRITLQPLLQYPEKMTTLKKIKNKMKEIKPMLQKHMDFCSGIYCKENINAS